MSKDTIISSLIQQLCTDKYNCSYKDICLYKDILVEKISHDFFYNFS